MKSFTRLAIAGITGIVFFKLFATVLLPMMAMLFGLIMATIKLALVAAVAYFVWTLVRKKEREVEIVVED